METKIETLLKSITDLPVLANALPNVIPCVTFHLYNETGILFGSGTAVEEGASCQIDIWYKAKNEVVKNLIKSINQTITNEKYFSYPVKETTYETGTKIYHTYFTFEIIDEREEL